MAQANPYPLRVNPMVMKKFKVLAAENGRSVNKDLNPQKSFTIKSCINTI